MTSPTTSPYIPTPGQTNNNWSGSNFNQTGIPGLTPGSTAYPPGSSMAQFLDGLNGEMATATSGANGQGSVIQWAQGLQQQQELRKQQQAASGGGAASMFGAGGAGGAGGGIQQLMQMFMMIFQQMGGGGGGGAPTAM